MEPERGRWREKEKGKIREREREKNEELDVKGEEGDMEIERARRENGREPNPPTANQHTCLLQGGKRGDQK